MLVFDGFPMVDSLAAETSEKIQAATAVTQAPLNQVLSECRSAFAWMAFLSLITNILSVVPTLYMMNMFDRVLSSRSGITMVSLVTLVTGVYLFWSALEWIRNRLMLRISLRIDWDMASRVFDAAFRKSAGGQRNNMHQTMGDLLLLRAFLTGRPILSVIDAPFALVYILVGGLIHPWLAAFALGATVMVALMALLNQRLATPALRAANEASHEANRLANECLQHSETALAMGMLPAIRRRWYARHRWFLQNQINGSEASGVIGWSSQVITRLTPSLQMALGIYLAIEGHITGGMVIAATFLINRSVSPLKSLIQNWKEIVNARLALERLNRLLLEHESIVNRMRLPRPSGRLVVQNLCVQASGSKRKLLQNIHFSLECGQMLAVVGPNGAGKSSLLRTLLGLWVPVSGSVRLDGVEVSDWNPDELGPCIGYVPQEAELFEATVAENIARLGEVDADRVVTAAKQAGVHELILLLPAGYDTVLGDGGYRLSAGQAQRIAIARALYGEPSLVVMDEPNAKLDDAAETALMGLLEKLRSQAVTVVYSTHRPRLLALADVMLVLQEGQQTAVGPVRDLIAQRKDPRRERNGLTTVASAAGHPDTETEGGPAIREFRS